MDRPAAAPWDALPEPRNLAAEMVVREWLESPDLRSVPVVCDDEGAGQPAHQLLEVSTCRYDELFSAGDQVAFHVAQTGRYLGGLEGLDDLVAQPARIETAGLVTVLNGRVVEGRVVRDRLGTSRALRAAADGAAADSAAAAR